MYLILTRKGIAIDVTNPATEDIDIGDIAAGLANVCFAPGRTARPITAAEFAIAMCNTAERELGINDPAGQLAALLAIAQMAYVPALDPMQADLWGSKLIGVHMHLHRAIASRFCLRSACASYAHGLKAAYTHTEASMVRDLFATQQSMSFSIPAEKLSLSWLQFDRDRYQEGSGVWTRAFLDTFNRISDARIARAVPTTWPDNLQGAQHVA